MQKQLLQKQKCLMLRNLNCKLKTYWVIHLTTCSNVLMTSPIGKTGTPDAERIEEYKHGRIFDQNGELRWHKQPDGYALLYLSEGDLPEGFTAFGEWETSEPQEASLLGGGDTKPWRDTRIPRKLKYPMKWCQFPKIKIIQYKEKHFSDYPFYAIHDFC